AGPSAGPGPHTSKPAAPNRPAWPGGVGLREGRLWNWTYPLVEQKCRACPAGAAPSDRTRLPGPAKGVEWAIHLCPYEFPADPAGNAPSGSRVHEPVAQPSHREQVDGIVGILLHLLAQPLHVDVERLRVAEVVRAPDLGDHEVPREEPPFSLEEHLEQLELLL